MSDWRQWCQGKLVSPDTAVSEIKSGERVVLGNAFYPGTLWVIIDALGRRRDQLQGVIVVASSHPWAPWLAPGWEHSFEVWDTFPGRLTREAIQQGRAHYVTHPFCFRHPYRLLEPGRVTPHLGADWAVIPVGPPNANGYCTFGHTVYGNPSQANTARRVIAVVHPNFPWTYGETIHVSKIDYLVESAAPPPEKMAPRPPVPEDEARAAEVIGAFASGLIRDGDTIQVGTGTAPMAVEAFLNTKNDLGVHSEQLGSVAILNLVKTGVVTGKKKNIHPGKVLISFSAQQADEPWRECLEFLHENPVFEFRDLSYACYLPLIASNDNMVAVNGILAMDLRGQVMIDHLGDNPIVGLGGNLAFSIGSHYSKGGRCIHVLMSTALRGKASRIVPRFPEGAQINIQNVYVDYLVTEHGVVNLEGLTPKKRAETIISVAHPNFQPELRREAKKMFGP